MSRYLKHDATMDFDTFAFIIKLMKPLGVEAAEVSEWSNGDYGFTYTFHGDTYSSSFSQCQFTWHDAAVRCIQVIKQKIEQHEKAKRKAA